MFATGIYSLVLNTNFPSSSHLESSRHMVYNFDEPVERRGSDSGKWHYYGADILPMWVADMDFRSAAPIMEALHRRVEHGVFGYGTDSPQLKEIICARMQRLYDWEIAPADIVFLPGLVCGLNV